MFPGFVKNKIENTICIQLYNNYKKYTSLQHVGINNFLMQSLSFEQRLSKGNPMTFRDYATAVHDKLHKGEI